MSDLEIFTTAEFAQLIKKHEDIRKEHSTSHEQVNDLQKMASAVPYASSPPASSSPEPQTGAKTPPAKLTAVLPMLAQDLTQIGQTRARIQSLETEIQRVQEQERNQRIAIYIFIAVVVFLCLCLLIFALGHH